MVDHYHMSRSAVAPALLFTVAGVTALAAAVLVAGCHGDTGIALTVTPDHASLYGQTQITVTGDFAALGQIGYFSVAGVQVVEAKFSGSTVTATLQGATKPGRYDIVISGSRGTTIRHNVFTYDAPTTGVPLSWMAFGASFTQGTESLGIDPHTQRYGVSAHIARAAGVYLGLPLFSWQLAPPLQPNDFTADCEQIPGTGAGVTTLETVLTSAETGLFDLRYGRLDWTLQARNVAVGGATVSDVLDGVRGAKALLAHIVNDPDVDSGDAVGAETTSMIDRVEAIDPDIGFSTDLLGNDIDQSVVQPEDLAPEMITPVATIEPLLERMFARLGKLHGKYFIANMPKLTFLPKVKQLRKQRLAAGSDTAESFDAKVQRIDDLTAQYNDALRRAMAPYPNLIAVDFQAYVDDVLGGVTVGGEQLTVDRWGGLISLDDLHLTDTGYALYAQKFIDRINAVTGAHIPAVDVAAVHAQDALSPSRLPAGYSCAPARQ
ncbi:MAG: outer membrane protein [Myxococcales bacterium]|nr:outer membrane protein [Myxococcales bacterium]